VTLNDNKCKKAKLNFFVSLPTYQRTDFMKPLLIYISIVSLMMLFLSGCMNNSDTIQQGNLSFNVVDIFEVDTDATELARSVGSGDTAKISQMIASGSDVNKVGKYEITPLWWAAWAKNYEGFAALLEKGANPNAQRAEGLPIMHLIANMKDARLMEVALKHGGDPNLRDNQSGETPLFLAVQNGYKQQIDLLLGAKADVNIQTPVSRWTVTMVAIASRADYETAYRLLQAGVDPTLKAEDGRTLADIIETRSINASNNHDPWRVKVIEFLRNKGIAIKSTPN
jgi:ankyrin repeat protein